MPYYYYGFDPTYFLVIIGAVICMIASARVKSTYNKYSQYRSASGMTGAQAAQRILNSAGIYDVTIQHVSGNLTDHYNPSAKTLNLSDSVYNSTSVAAVGVAAHECGHAIQHQNSYFPLTLRTAIVPAANLGSTLAWPLILIGLFFTRNTGAVWRGREVPRSSLRGGGRWAGACFRPCRTVFLPPRWPVRRPPPEDGWN